MASPSMASHSKRSAAAAAPPAKRFRNELTHVEHALRDAEGVPEMVVDMLRDLVPYSLAVYSDERHEYQAKVVDILGGVLDGTAAKLKANAYEAHAKVAGGDVDKARRMAASIELADTVAEKKCAAARAEATRFKAQIGYASADEDLKNKLKAQKEGDKSYNDLGSKKNALDAVAIDMFAPMQAAATSGKQVEGFVRAVGWLLLDDTLLDTLPAVVAKDPAARTDFDSIVISQVEKALSEKSGKLGAELAALEPDRGARAALVATSQSNEGAAKAALFSAKQASAAADDEVDNACIALTTAEKAWKGFGEEMKAAVVAEGTTKEQLRKFLDGPVAAFTTLKAMIAPRPPDNAIETSLPVPE